MRTLSQCFPTPLTVTADRFAGRASLTSPFAVRVYEVPAVAPVEIFFVSSATHAEPFQTSQASVGLPSVVTLGTGGLSLASRGFVRDRANVTVLPAWASTFSQAR